MNENLDLVKILKDCPKDMKLYSTIHGEVTLSYVSGERVLYPICVNWGDGTASFTQNGRFYKTGGGECTLFPSKDQRDWSKFEIPIEKFDCKTLKPFDKVLVRYYYDGFWKCDTFSHKDENGVYCVTGRWKQLIPFNEETEHLLGTTNMPNRKYVWWEE